MTLRRSTSFFVALLCAASCLVSVPARLLDDDHAKLENSDKVVSKRIRMYIISGKPHVYSYHRYYYLVLVVFTHGAAALSCSLQAFLILNSVLYCSQHYCTVYI
jgi:hypothetical protein